MQNISVAGTWDEPELTNLLENIKYLLCEVDPKFDYERMKKRREQLTNQLKL